MLAYFVLVAMGVRILQEIFKELSGTEYFKELSRLSGLAASTLDTTKNVDDLLVTFFALTITLVLILPVAWTHIITKGAAADQSLTQTLVALSIIVAGVMLVLEDNLARAFSLVGVVAAVRFRNTLKDPKDAVYVFLSLGIGMACGLQAYHVALFVSFFVCVILIAMWAYDTGAPAVSDAGLLQTLRASERKGQRSPAEAFASLSPAAKARLEDEVEAQTRYIHHARLFAEKSTEKRANAVITVETSAQSSAPRDAVNLELFEHRGKWRLLGAHQQEGRTVLEYLGRVSKKRSPPLALLERLRTAHPDVQTVTFRSLRKMFVEPIELPSTAAANDAQDELEAPPANSGGQS